MRIRISKPEVRWEQHTKLAAHWSVTEEVFSLADRLDAAWSLQLAACTSKRLPRCAKNVVHIFHDYFIIFAEHDRNLHSGVYGT